MPIPNPTKDESEAQFMSRCMTNPSMEKDYEDQNQRTIICVDSWKKSKGDSNMKDENIKRDEKGRIIIAENVPLIITAEIEEE